MTTTTKLAILAGPAAFCLIYFFLHPSGMSPEAHAILAATVWIAIWWISEAIPIGATSLLPLILFPLLGAMDADQVASAYGDKLIFLYIGGFVIALAMERWHLHRRVALTIISWVGTRMRMIILGFIIATGFLSMWISNTATTLMMLPIGLAIVAQLQDLIKGSNEQLEGAESFGKALMMTIAYAASMGGVATLIGSPTNLVFSGAVEKEYGITISFIQWMKYGLPIALVLLAICWWYMTRVAFKLGNGQIPGSRQIIRTALKELGRIKWEEKWILAVFICVAVAWMSGKLLREYVSEGINDTAIGLIGGLLLFAIPTRTPNTFRIMDWNTAKRLPWDVLLLFGGGFAIAEGFKVSGLSQWIGDQLTLLQGLSLLVILFLVVALVNFLTEITSNVATCNLMMVIMIALAPVIDVHPYLLMVPTAVAASCAFMLPVATPPNAVAFGSGYFSIKEMVRVGFWLNVISIIVIVVYSYFFLPMIWNINELSFPEAMGP